MSGMALEKMIIDRLTDAGKPVLYSRYLDFTAKADFVITLKNSVAAVQVKLGDGHTDTHPIKELVAEKVKSSNLKCVTIKVYGGNIQFCNPYRLIKILEEAKDGDVIKINGFEWKVIE